MCSRYERPRHFLTLVTPRLIDIILAGLIAKASAGGLDSKLSMSVLRRDCVLFKLLSSALIGRELPLTCVGFRPGLLFYIFHAIYLFYFMI